jgi:hypothetical protein
VKAERRNALSAVSADKVRVPELQWKGQFHSTDCSPVRTGLRSETRNYKTPSTSFQICSWKSYIRLICREKTPPCFVKPVFTVSIFLMATSFKTITLFWNDAPTFHKCLLPVLSGWWDLMMEAAGSFTRLYGAKFQETAIFMLLFNQERHVFAACRCQHSVTKLRRPCAGSARPSVFVLLPYCRNVPVGVHSQFFSLFHWQYSVAISVVPLRGGGGGGGGVVTDLSQPAVTNDT